MNDSRDRQTWTIRSYRPGDEQEITALFRRVFGREVPEGYWDWKLRHFRSEHENEWVAESRGRIVGHYAVTPIPFKTGGRAAIVPHGCDAMTHPEYRRQGILTALGRRANEVWESAGSPYQIGFHYGGWGSVRESLGWRHATHLVWVKLWISPFSSLAQRYRLPGVHAWRLADRIFNRAVSPKQPDGGFGTDGNRIQLESVLCADERFDRLWEKVGTGYRTLAVRNRAWVQWRYLDKPGVRQEVTLATRSQEPLGYIALRISGEPGAARAVILDCFAAPDDFATMTTLLAHAVAKASSYECSSLAALAAPGSDLFHLLVRSGFWRGRHGYDFSIIPYASMNKSAAEKWFVTGAEGDVI